MAQISFENSISTRDVIGPYLFEGEYVSVIDFAEINLLFQGSLVSPGDNVVITSYLSNDRFNILKEVATTITYPLDNKLIKVMPSAKFLKVQLQLNGSILNLNLSTVLRIILTGSDFLTDVQLRETALPISASNGDALTVTNGSLNVNLGAGEEITVSGEVEVSNFPDIQKISATNGDALTVSDGGLNVNILNGETIVVSGDVIVQGIQPQFRFYATPLTNTSAVYADGAPGVNVNGGWLYVNTGGSNKINWYVYANSADQASTAKKVGSIVSMYAVIYQKTLTVAPIDSKNPFIAFYTLPEAANNTSWYKNRYNFSAYTDQSSVVGLKLLYIGVDNPLIHPEITTRIQLLFDSVNSTNTLEAGANEDLWLGTIGSSSNTSAGNYNFVFSEYGIDFTEEARLPTVLPIIDNKVQVSGIVSVSNFTPQMASNLRLVSQLIVGQWYKIETLGTTLAANWIQIGASIAGETVAVGRVFKCIANVGVGTATLSIIIYNENVVVSGSVGISTSVLPTGASTELTLNAINTKTPSLGQKASSDDCQPVVLTTAQVDLLKPLATQPISGSVGITGALPAGGNIIGSVNINGPGILLFSPPNTISVSLATVGQWYKLETIGTTTTLQWQTLGVEPVIGRIFKALVVGTLGTGTIVQLLYNENVVVKSSALPTDASTETTLSSINTKLPSSIGQQITADSLSVCLPTAQIDLIKPLATQPVSGNIGITGQIPTGNNLIGQITVNNPGNVIINCNIISVSAAIVGQWYRVEAIGTTTTPQWAALGVEPVLYRIFKALVTGTLGTGTISFLQYNENVKVSNFPALQPVSLSNPEIAIIPNTIAVNKCKIGFWYKIQQLGTTPNQSWIDLGTEPIVGRVFLCLLLETWTIGGTGEVSILPYFSGRYSQEGNTIVQPAAVLEVDFHSVNPHPFVSSNVGNTSQIVYGQYTKLRNVILQKTDSTITYVYLYCKEGNNPTSEDTPWFRFIVKDTTPFTLYFNQEFVYGISIRATSDLNGTTDPDPNTLFVNITFDQ